MKEKIIALLERIARALETLVSSISNPDISTRPEDWCTRKEAADILDLKVSYLERLACKDKGILPYIRKGTVVYYRLSDVTAYAIAREQKQ